MVRSRLSPREIVRRLQIIEGLTGEGLPLAEALRSAGVREAEYERWRDEYNGLRRTLGPLLCATTEVVKRNAPHNSRSLTQGAPVTSSGTTDRARERLDIVDGDSDMRWWAGRRSIA